MTTDMGLGTAATTNLPKYHSDFKPPSPYIYISTYYLFILYLYY